MKSNLDRPLDSSAVMQQNTQREQQRARQAQFGQSGIGLFVQPQYSQQQQAAHGATPGQGTDAIYSVAAERPAVISEAGFTASGFDYSVFAQVETFPAYGSKRSVNVFSPIRGAKTKVKGSSDYGGGTIMMADLPADAGQVILKALEASVDGGSIKIAYADGETHYLYVHVMSWELQQNQEGAFLKRACEIAVLDAPVIVAAP